MTIRASPDDGFRIEFDVQSFVNDAVRRLVDAQETALREAVADELRRQGWTVIPPGGDTA